MPKYSVLFTAVTDVIVAAAVPTDPLRFVQACIIIKFGLTGLIIHIKFMPCEDTTTPIQSDTRSMPQDT